MRDRLATLLLLGVLGGCSLFGSGGQAFSVFFQPYSSDLDPQAQDTIHSAASFAQAHPMMPVALVGYSAPADPGRDIDGLSEQRAEAVKRLLVGAGISPMRISTMANGTTDPSGKPNLAVRRVDINVGL